MTDNRSLAIMQPYFFPYIGYFQLIDSVDEFLLYDNLNFIDSGWIARNRIRQKNAAPVFFIVPLKNKSSNCMIGEIKIDNGRPWRKKMLKSFVNAYNKAEHFEEIMPVLEEILSVEYETVSELNAESIKRICRLLDIKTPVLTDNSPYEDIEREIAGLDKLPRMHERAVRICQRHGVQRLNNPIGGTALYSKEFFKEYGIELNFIKTGKIEYNQFWQEFAPSLSIIDVLMHCGAEKTKELLKNYTLV